MATTMNELTRKVALMMLDRDATQESAYDLADQIIALVQQDELTPANVSKAVAAAPPARPVGGLAQKFDDIIWNMDTHQQAAQDCARVAVEELLTEPTEAEKAQMSHDCSSDSPRPGSTGWDNFYFALRRMFANRRSRLLEPEKTLTPEERVAPYLDENGIQPHLWSVRLDGHCQGVAFLEKKDADIYRLGLIASLKSGGQK